MIILYNSAPILTLETTGPDDGWHIVQKDCAIGTDASESIFDLPADIKSKVLWVDLCFRAMEFSENRTLIPYKIDKNRMYWGGERYDTEVTSYIEKRKITFVLEPGLLESALTWAQLERRKRWTANFKETCIYVFSFVIFLEILGRAIGWIMRGFFRKEPQQEFPTAPV